VTKLIAYRIHSTGQKIVSGRPRRKWMDETHNRYAYRCLPLTIANAMGWEILMPAAVSAEWNGGSNLSDIKVESHDPAWQPEHLALSHFGHGVLTFPIGYLFRTDPGVALWARGVPNLTKDGIAPLDGIIETDWLAFTFTMNWQFTRPGRVVFQKDEPYCFITPVAYRALEDVRPEIVPLADAPDVAAQFNAYSEARNSFNSGLKQNDPDIAKQGWQKWYMRGENPFGGEANPLHISKLSLAEPVERTTILPPAASKVSDEEH
jgi:hypothetical protein